MARPRIVKSEMFSGTAAGPPPQAAEGAVSLAVAAAHRASPPARGCAHAARAPSPHHAPPPRAARDAGAGLCKNTCVLYKKHC